MAFHFRKFVKNSLCKIFTPAVRFIHLHLSVHLFIVFTINKRMLSNPLWISVLHHNLTVLLDESFPLGLQNLEPLILSFHSF